jgi:outer membrane protein assembly factor BamB
LVTGAVATTAVTAGCSDSDSDPTVTVTLEHAEEFVRGVDNVVVVHASGDQEGSLSNGTVTDAEVTVSVGGGVVDHVIPGDFPADGIREPDFASGRGVDFPWSGGDHKVFAIAVVPETDAVSLNVSLRAVTENETRERTIETTVSAVEQPSGSVTPERLAAHAETRANLAGGLRDLVDESWGVQMRESLRQASFSVCLMSTGMLADSVFETVAGVTDITEYVWTTLTQFKSPFECLIGGRPPDTQNPPEDVDTEVYGPPFFSQFMSHADSLSISPGAWSAINPRDDFIALSAVLETYAREEATALENGNIDRAESLLERQVAILTPDPSASPASISDRGIVEDYRERGNAFDLGSINDGDNPRMTITTAAARLADVADDIPESASTLYSLENLLWGERMLAADLLKLYQAGEVNGQTKGELTVVTGDATATGATEATLTGELTDIGPAETVQCSFEWRKQGADEWNETDEQPLSEPGQFESTLTDLEANTTYECRALATPAGADVSTARGSIRTVQTDPRSVSVETVTATEVSSSAATLVGDLRERGNVESVQCFFEYRERGTDGWNETERQTRTEVGAFNSELSNLSGTTTYEFRAVAAAESMTHRGDIRQFTTETALVAAGNWLSVRYDVANRGHNPNATAITDTPAVAWQSEVGDSITNGISVVDGVVYASNNDGSVYALDAETGKKLWHFETGDTIETAPTIANAVAYVGSHDGNVYAFDANTGEAVWDAPVETGDIVPGGVTVVDGTAYVISWDHHLYALDAQTGERQWRRKFWQTDATPTVVDGTVYFGSYGSKVYAVSATTGRQQWDATVSGTIYTATPVRDGRVYAATRDISDRTGAVAALSTDDGTKRWTFERENGIVTGVAATADTVYVGTQRTSNPAVYALDAASGEIIWQRSVAADVAAAPTVADGVVCATLRDKSAMAIGFDAETGERLWKMSGHAANTSPVIIDGVVYLGTLRGTYVYALTETA